MTDALRTDPAGGGGFTLSGDPRAEARVARDLQLVVTAVREHLPDAEAVVLVGGFGRGEGAVVVGPDGPVPYNDYDLVVVVPDEAEAWPALRAAARSLRGRLAVDAVDLIPRARDRWTRLEPSMFHVDLRAGGRVLHGAPDLLERLPVYGPDAVGPADAAVLMRNRLVTCLEAHPGLATAPVSLRQSAKVVLAWVDAEACLRGTYATSYREKIRGIEAWAGPDEVAAAEWALAVRAGSSGGEDQAMARWLAAADLLARGLRRVHGDPDARAPAFLARWVGEEVRALGLVGALRRLRVGRLESPLHGAQAALVLSPHDPAAGRWADRLLAAYGGAGGSERWLDAARTSVRLWYEVFHDAA